MLNFCAFLFFFGINQSINLNQSLFVSGQVIQESPAVADKPARRESMPKLLQFDVLTVTTRLAPLIATSRLPCLGQLQHVNNIGASCGCEQRV